MKIEVNMQTFAKDINEMRSLATKAEKEIKELFDSTDELNTMWDGVTKLAFMDQVGKDQYLFSEVIRAVNQLIDEYNEANSHYHACESKIESKLDALKF